MPESLRESERAKARLRQVLKQYDSKSLAHHMTQERAQTCAVMLAVLPEEERSPVLALLPKEMAAEVLSRLAHLGTVLPEIIDMIAEAFERRGEK